jgi:hypothetical protein
MLQVTVKVVKGVMIKTMVFLDPQRYRKAEKGESRGE